MAAVAKAPVVGKIFLAKLAIFSLTLLLGGISASAALDFSGEQITWIIPFRVGGGSDVWARLYAPFFQRYLPGHPIVAVQNIPGGGSITGGNYFHLRSEREGPWMLFGSSGSTNFPYLLGNSRVQYEYLKYHIVFASPTGGVAYIQPGLGVTSARNLKGFDGQLYYASQGVTSLDMVPLLAFDMLGLKVKAIFGYRGRGAGRVAFEQGETNIDYQTSTAYIKNVRPLVRQKLAVPLMTWGFLDDRGNIVRDPLEPELPSFPEVFEWVHGRPPAGPAWEAWKALFVSGFGLQKALWLPGRATPEVVSAFRAAAARVVADPEFKQIIEKSLGGYPQVVGEQASEAFDQVLNMSPEDKAWVIRWIFDSWGIEVK